MSTKHPEPTAAPTHDALVSVIIPTHNRADLVVRSIRSVLAQTYRNLECIVVDDASTDSTPDAVQAIQDPRLIYLRHEQSKHASATRNTGIAAATGEYIAFLDDDDEWLPEKLEKQVALLRTLPAKVGMVYCWMDYYDNETFVSTRRPTLRGSIFDQVLDEQRIGNCSTLLVRRAVIATVRGFDERLPRGNDGDFIRRVCLTYQVDVVLQALVKCYVGHGFARITANDREGMLNAINSQKDKLAKFAEQLPRYPRQTAHIYALIGESYAQLRELGQAAYWFGRALATSPASRGIYTRLIRSLKHVMFNRVARTRGIT